MKELELYNNYSELTDEQEIFGIRLLLEQAKCKIADRIEDLDKHLINTMKGKNIESFSVMLGDNENKVFYANEKKEKVVDPKKLEGMLFGDDPRLRGLAKACIGLSASAWKVAQVRVLADTLGLNRKELISTEYTDKVKVNIIPVNLLGK